MGGYAAISKNIVVVGGGTAGWMAALLTKKNYPEANITVVESDAIGILGAGEGTTPHFIEFLNEVGIPVSVIANECKLTFKFGIDFKNWGSTGSSYFHPFSANPSLDSFDFLNGCVADYVVKNSVDIDRVQIFPVLNNASSVPARFEESVFVDYNRLGCVNFMAAWGVHFDARLLASVLRKIAEARGIKRVEGVVVSQTMCGNKIESLIFDDSTRLPVDFLFDCTGFARQFVGKLYKTPWISYDDFLPMDSAVPFFIPHEGNVPAMTSAIAMRAGWIWQIPVQGRYGCGYVFDSRYISKDEALREASDYFGVAVHSDKVFSFKAGCFENALVENCAAVGLSQGFVEPLEATSLWATYLTLKEIFSLGLFVEKSDSVVRAFNKNVVSRNKNIADFLHLHYLGARDDSKFWREFRDVNKTPSSILDVVDRYESGFYHTIGGSEFSLRSYVAVMRGLGYAASGGDKASISKDTVQLFVDNQKRVTSSCMSHQSLLDWVCTAVPAAAQLQNES